jgi:hypothetical protein
MARWDNGNSHPSGHTAPWLTPVGCDLRDKEMMNDLASGKPFWSRGMKPS